MKTQLLAAAMLALSTSAIAQDVGVSVTVGQPGFFGRIDIGNMAPPPVLYPQPVIIQRPARIIAEPLYLRVPPGHAKNWGKHCGRYNACGRNVYFVRDEWYTNEYAPRYRDEHRHRDHDRRDRDYDDDHGHGHGKHKDKGHGHGHGKHKD
ncbi:hypothetical protein SAMN05518865_112164 [Duganella sp. CF458]|uniref:hypothetical protein n=1 Tax=Duganella sp. CF458 TaxID=1884368 RepID=UPI0008EC04E9|nr:hypothetical protein [Duganella sp. CF458]SFG46330.1 hypothetical protein SAMN05518865_112164 [Duganella sp. CF458]